MTIGGTSAVAPLWAALKALTDANAGRTLPFGPEVGGTEDLQQNKIDVERKRAERCQGHYNNEVIAFPVQERGWGLECIARVYK